MRFFRSVDANELFDLFTILLEEAVCFDRDTTVLTHPFADRVGDVHLAEVIVGGFLHRVVDVTQREFAHTASFDDRLTEAVERAALVLHRLVVLEDVLAHLEVALFDFALRLLDRAREHRVLEIVAFLHAKGRQHLEHRLAGEHLHQVVVHREEEAARTVVALATSAATQLIVDTAAFVAFGTHDVETAHFFDVLPHLKSVDRRKSGGIECLDERVVGHRRHLLLWILRLLDRPVLEQHAAHCTSVATLNRVRTEDALAEVAIAKPDDLGIWHRCVRFLRADVAALPVLDEFFARKATKLDVGTATGHVRRDHHAADISGAEHDFCFAIMLLRVEHFVTDLILGGQHARDHFALLDACRTDEHRATNIVECFDFLDDRIPLVLLREEHFVLAIEARDREIRRNRHDVELVDLVELFRFGVGRTGHAGESLVQLEVVLNRDRRHGLGLFFDLDLFFGFDGLVKTV